MLAEGESLVTTEKNLWRSNKTIALHRYQMALNIHFYPNATLETTRLLELISHGNLVISEPSTDPDLDRQFQDIIIFAPKDKLRETLHEWQQKDPDVINKYVETATNRFINDPNFVYPVNKELKTYNEQNSFDDQIPEPDTLNLKQPVLKFILMVRLIWNLADQHR